MIINPKFQLKTILELDTPKVTGSQNTNENKWAELVAADLFANELTEEKFATMFVQVLQKANPSELYVLESPLGIKFLDCGDDFTACSILSEGLMGFMQEQTPGTLLFGVPSRSELYFTAVQDAQSASNLQALVIQSWRENAHPISANLYTWQNQKIELYT